MSRKAAFVDRDGTLNEMVYDETHGLLDSPRRPEQVVLVKGAGAFLKGLRDLGYLIVIVTNQPGVAKGTLTLAELDAVNARLAELLAKDGGSWDDLLFSPYHPSGGPWARREFVKDSDLRKPKPGMLLAAAQKHGIDLAESWMIGDGLVDVQAGCAAGTRTVLVTSLNITQIEQFFVLKDGRPDIVAANLGEALSAIAGSSEA